MPLDIQVGGFAEKIRRAIGVRGRMPLRLDETVIPVVEVGKYDLPPFRMSEMDWMSNCDQAQVAAEYPFGAIALPPNVPGAIVVESLLVTSEATDSYSVYLIPHVDIDATDNAAPAQLVWNVEHQPLAVSTGNGYRTPFPVSHRGTDIALGLTGSLLFTFRVLINTNERFPLRVTLRPGWGLACFRRTVNTAMNCSWRGQYYPEAPGTA